MAVFFRNLCVIVILDKCAGCTGETLKYRSSARFSSLEGGLSQSSLPISSRYRSRSRSRSSCSRAGLGDRDRWHRLVVPYGCILRLYRWCALICVSNRVGDGERAGLVATDQEPLCFQNFKSCTLCSCTVFVYLYSFS